jgi:DeoR/GlpR family transcriptional regulator of sugar metabolism
MRQQSAAKMTDEGGLDLHESYRAEVLRKLVDNVKIKVVAADHSKLGSVSKYLLCPTKE